MSPLFPGEAGFLSALAGAALGVLATWLTVACYRYVWVVPNELHAEDQGHIVRLERERDTARDQVLELAQKLQDQRSRLDRLDDDNAKLRAAAANGQSSAAGAIAAKAWRDDWLALAADFRQMGSSIRADWSKTSAEDSWRICGGSGRANKDAERLCEYAAAILSRSPNAGGCSQARAASEKYANLSAQWCQFIRELDHDFEHGRYLEETSNDGRRLPIYSGRINELGNASARACMMCATMDA